MFRSVATRVLQTRSPIFINARCLASQNSSATSALSFKKHIRQRRFGPVPVVPQPTVEDAVTNILYNTPTPSNQPETRHILNCLVQNEPGVLSRVSGVLAARGFNIESLVVANTEVEDLSRMTIIFNGRNVQIEQARRQLEDLVPVWAVLDYTKTKLVERELLLIKVSILGPEHLHEQLPTAKLDDDVEYEDENVSYYEKQAIEAPSDTLRETFSHLRALTELTRLFDGKIVDVSSDSVIIELCAKSSRLSSFMKLCKPFIKKKEPVVYIELSNTMRDSEKIATKQINHDEMNVEFDADELLLQSLGYKQDLNRSISAFSNFAVAYSCCSVLSGLGPMWGNAMTSSGSAGVIWGWLITGIFTTIVALSLAEICSSMPVSGGLYYWVSHLATSQWMPVACWVCGWCNWIGLCFGITSVDLGLAKFIASVVSIWNTDTQPLSVYAQYGIFIAILIIHGFINSVAVKWNGFMNQGSFFANTIGILLIVVVGLSVTKPLATSKLVFRQFYNGSGFSSDGYAFLLVILQSQYTLSGYDSAAHMAEETKNSQNGSPFGILVSVIANAVSGFAFLIAINFMVTNFNEQILGEDAISPQMVQVFYDGVGPTWTMVFVVFILASTFTCGSALTLGSSCMVYAFARDGAMPYSKFLHKLNKDTKTPVNAVWFNILIAAIVGILYMINSTAYEAIVSVNTIGSQMSYLVPILLRITSSRTTFKPGPFNLGKLSIVLGWISSLWLIFTCVLFICPTTAPITADNMNYAIVPFATIMACSMTYFYFWGRKWFTGPLRAVDGQEVILDESLAEAKN